MSKDAIEPVSEEDREWLASAEAHIQAVLSEAFGELSLARTEEDLDLVQRALDESIVQAGQELELQCLGVVLGNVFVEQTEMEWAEVTNEYGTLLAVHAPRIGFTLYPVTMISQRVEDGREVNARDLYTSFVNDLGLQPGSA